MASTDIDLIIEAVSKGFDKVNTDLKKVGDSSEAAGKKAEGGGKGVGALQGAFGKLVGSGVLLAAGAALLQFGAASITAASDAQEMQSKFDTVFGALGGQVTSQLDQFAEASNRSTNELKGFAATIQDTLKPMGIAADEAANFSVDLVKLGTDLASFNNMPMDEAMRRLQGTLIGSHENALAFGVVINENTLKAEMAANGWNTLTGAQLEAAKVQARINLLMAGTTDAQGDAIKTADSYANQVKGMQAAVTDLQIAIGTALLPVMTELVGLVTQAADRLIVAAGAAGAYNDQATEIITANVESAKSFEELVAEAAKIDEVGSMMGGLATTVTGTNAAMRDGIVEVSKGLAGQADSFEQFESVIGSWSAKSRKALQDYAKAQGMTVEEFYNFERANHAATAATQGSDAALMNSVKNYQGLAEATAEATEALVYNDEIVRAVNSTLLEYGGNLGPTSRELEEMAYASGDLGDYQEAMLAPIRENTEAIEEQDKALAELKSRQAGYFQEAIKSEGAIGLYNETAAQMADRTIYVSNLTGEQQGALSDLRSEYEKAAGTLSDYEIGAKGAGLTEEQRNEKIAEQRDRMAELEAAMSPLVELGGEYANVQGTMTINEDALNQAIYDSAAASGASAEQLAILGGALGLYSDEAVEAALKSAAIQIKIDELAQAYVDGKIGVDDMRQGIQDFIASLDGVPDSVTTDVQVTGIDSALAKVGGLQTALSGLGNQVSAADAAGAVERGGGVGLAGGADFVVPPGYPNDSFGPLYVQSGEHVKVTPAGQAGAAGGSVTNINAPITITTRDDPQAIGVASGDALMRAIKSRGMG